MWRYVCFNASQTLFPKSRVYKWIDNLKFNAEKGDAGLVGNIYFKVFDYEESMFLMRTLKPNELFVDVGANLGHFSLLAAGPARAEVIAIEPIPSTYRKLERNVKLNKLDERIRCLNIGLGEREGNLRFLKDRTVMNRVALEGEEGTIEIAVYSLDQILKGKDPVFLKIDVEGFEYPVLKGAHQVLSNPSLMYLMLEFNDSGTKFGYSDSEVFELVTSYGFAPIRFDVTENKISFTSGYNTQKFNTLFVRKEPDSTL